MSHRLASELKRRQYSVDYVPEFAKECVWEQWSQIFGEQDFFLAMQNRRLRRLVENDVQYAVQDTSLLHSLFFLPDDFPQSIRQPIVDIFDSYDNIIFVLERNPAIPYENQGRNETENEAKIKDHQMRAYLNIHYGHCTHYIKYWENGLETMLDIVANHQKPSIK